MMVRVLVTVLGIIFVPSICAAATLRIFSNVSGASVFVEGNYVGETLERQAFMVEDLVAGREYEVRVTADGYEPWFRRVVLREGVPNSVRVELAAVRTHGVLIVEVDEVDYGKYLFYERWLKKLKGMECQTTREVAIPSRTLTEQRLDLLCIMPIGVFVGEICLKGWLAKEVETYNPRTGRLERQERTWFEELGCMSVELEIRGSAGTVLRLDFSPQGLRVNGQSFRENCFAIRGRKSTPACLERR